MGRRHPLAVGTRETRLERGRRRGLETQNRLLAEIRQARLTAGISQRDLATMLKWSQAAYWRFETLRSPPSFVDVSCVASVLGLELGAGLHPLGDPIRDKGHQALIRRFRAVLSAKFRVGAEVPLPNPSDRRAWDLVLRLPRQIIGVEAETRVRDVQWLVRRMRTRQQDGGAHVVVLVLADTRANRALADDVRTALGAEWSTSPRTM